MMYVFFYGDKAYVFDMRVKLYLHTCPIRSIQVQVQT